jgi:uncharacterized protein
MPGKRRGRPCLRKRVAFDPKVKYFKPQGVPLFSLEIVEISREELEAVRLKNLKKFDQKECADKMKTSPATLQRLLAGSYEKIADALVNGKAIRIISE